MVPIQMGWLAGWLHFNAPFPFPFALMGKKINTQRCYGAFSSDSHTKWLLLLLGTGLSIQNLSFCFCVKSFQAAL